LDLRHGDVAVVLDVPDPAFEEQLQ
jgi:hypothetical protein